MSDTEPSYPKPAGITFPTGRTEAGNFSNDAVLEPLTETPHKQLLVIGIDHGSTFSLFYGRKAAETEILRQFPGKIHGFVIDSLSRIYTQGGSAEYIKKTLNSINPNDQMTFETWSYWMASQRGAYLIGADPTNVLAGLGKILQAEEKNTSMDDPYENRYKSIIGSDEFKKVRNTHGVATRELQNTQLLKGGALVHEAIGLGILLNLLRSKKKLSRRVFFKTSAGTAATMFLTAHLGNYREEQIIKEIDTARQAQTGMLEEAGFSNIGPYALRNLDQQTVYTQRDPDYEGKAFQRFALLNEANKIAIIWRNAFVAEFLNLPNSELMPGVPAAETANIPVVMGLNHLIVSKENTISWFMNHESERRAVLELLTGAIFQGIDNGTFGQVNKNFFKEDLTKFGNSYSISKQGDVAVHSVKAPFIQQLASKY